VLETATFPSASNVNSSSKGDSDQVGAGSLLGVEKPVQEP